MAVLVLGGRLPALTAARALRRAGYVVIAGLGREYSPVRYSRAPQGMWRHPGLEDGDRFGVALSRFLEHRPAVQAILPVGQQYVVAVAALRDRLPDDVAVATPDVDIVNACIDKGRLYEIAARAHVRHAPARSVTDLVELAAAADEIGYPCIVKPTVWTAPMPEERKAVICLHREDVERQLSRWPPGHAGLLVQRYVSGPRYNLHFIAERGRITESLQTRSLRSDRADGTGVGVEAISVTPDPRVTRSCETVLGFLGYTGAGLAQFIIPNGAEPYFLEVKPFLGSSHAFAEACGLGQAVAAVELVTRSARRREPRLSYPIGRRYAWTSRDLYGMLMARSRGEIGRRSALRWIAKAFRAAALADAHATWWWRDPLPTAAIFLHIASLLPWPGLRPWRNGRS